MQMRLAVKGNDSKKNNARDATATATGLLLKIIYNMVYDLMLLQMKMGYLMYPNIRQ